MLVSVMVVMETLPGVTDVFAVDQDTANRKGEARICGGKGWQKKISEHKDRKESVSMGTESGNISKSSRKYQNKYMNLHDYSN